MKKLLSIFASTTLVLTSSVAVVSCDWKTPPIKFDEISKVMKVVEKQVISNPNDEFGIAQLNSQAEEGESIFTMNYQQKSEDNSTNIDFRKAWSDAVINPVNTKIADYIHEGKNIITGEDDKDLKTEEMEALTAKIQTYHFTTRVSDVYVENAVSKTDSDEESYWLTDKYQSPVTAFKKTVDEKINPKEGNQPKNKDKNKLVANGDEPVQEGDWAKNFLIFDDNDIFNLSRSLKADWYLVRFNVSFGINNTEKDNVDKKVCFYLDVKFNA